VHLADRLSGPLLGLFGAEDKYPSPDQVHELEEVLAKHGKTFDFTIYDDAGHAFFAVDRPSYRPHAAVDGWQRIFAWFDRYLGS
jgi:carboxymethylenebutenolidase